MQRVWEAFENPLGLDGFSFLEFSSNLVTEIKSYFERLGFIYQGTDECSLYSQGNINLFVDEKPPYNNLCEGGYISAIGWRVKDAAIALEEAVKRGAEVADSTKKDLPAIYGIGSCLIYFVDSIGEDKLNIKNNVESITRLEYIDHIDHNVKPGRIDHWVNFYKEVFNFKEIKYFDIEAGDTAIIAKGVASPCGKMAINIVESPVGNNYVDRYLAQQGEGIQHVAYHAANLCNALEFMRSQGQKFLPVFDEYYLKIQEKYPDCTEDIERLKTNGILIDCSNKSCLQQVFTIQDQCCKPLFFEFINRQNYDGFGDVNVRNFLKSIES